MVDLLFERVFNGPDSHYPRVNTVWGYVERREGNPLRWILGRCVPLSGYSVGGYRVLTRLGFKGREKAPARSREKG